MRYMLLIYTNPANWAGLSEADQQKVFGEYGSFTKDIQESGEMIAGDPLADPSTARTVQVRGGKADVTDGPFVESKEHLAGYYIVECESAARAEALAARIPDARFAAVEVRPIMDMGGAEM